MKETLRLGIFVGELMDRNYWMEWIMRVDRAQAATSFARSGGKYKPSIMGVFFMYHGLLTRFATVFSRSVCHHRSQRLRYKRS